MWSESVSWLLRKLHGRPSLQNASWLMVEKLAGFVISAPVELFVARYLGPEKYGTLNYVIAFSGIFMSMAALGLRQITTRDLVWEHDEQTNVMGAAFVLHLVGGLLSILSAFATILIIRPSDQIVQIMVLIASLRNVALAFDVIDYRYQSRNQFGYVTSARVIGLVATAILTGSLILFDAPIEFYAFAFTFEFIVGAVLLVVLYFYTDGFLPWNWRTSMQTISRLFRESWLLTLSSLAIMVQSYIDQIMLGQMMNDSVVGQYSVAIRLIGYVSFASGIVVTSMAPSISSAKGTSEEAYHAKLVRLYEVMFVVFLVQAIPTLVFAKPVVRWLYGVEYVQAGTLLVLLAVRLLFANFGSARSLFITNNKLFKYALVTSVAGALINIGGNYFLIPIYGAVGAIIATIISFALTIFVSDAIYVKSRINFQLMITGSLKFLARFT